MHAIESIGPVLGIVAFIGLAILAFLLLQQARDIRRLREWAGRAPERASEAAEAVQAAAEASRDGEAAEDGTPAAGDAGRIRAAWDRLSHAARDRYAAFDRRSPVDGRYILAVLVVAVVAVGIVTSGFGLVGGGGRGGKHAHHRKQHPSVAVVNGTSTPGLADSVENRVVKRAGYEPGPIGNTTSSISATVVEYAGGQRSEARRLARAVKPKLGETAVQPMTSDVKDVAGKAKLALVLGLDDVGFAGGG